MLDLETLAAQKPHVAIATPCYGGMVHQNYLLSLIKLIYTCERYGVTLSFIIRGGDSLIPRTRNSIVAEFMATEGYTHLFWLDADIGFEPDAFFRLLRADREVAAGVYPMKKINIPDKVPADMTRDEFLAKYTRYPFNPISQTFKIDEDGMIEVLDAPTGFMLIKKQVIEKMIEHYPDHKIVADDMPGLEHIAAKIAKYDYRFFDVMTEANGRYLSEDYAFCRRWQAMGGKIYVDAASNLTHQGGHVYTGPFLQSLLINSKKNTEAPAETAPAVTTEAAPAAGEGGAA